MTLPSLARTSCASYGIDFCGCRWPTLSCTQVVKRNVDCGSLRCQNTLPYSLHGRSTNQRRPGAWYGFSLGAVATENEKRVNVEPSAWNSSVYLPAPSCLVAS